jgi:hypothetical protein
MSFYIALIYYRPRKPPIVTANDLATVVARLAETGKLKPSGMYGAKVKFGDSIDADDRETTLYEPQETGVILVGEIEWDLNCCSLTSVEEVIKSLFGNHNRIYRALIFLGTPTPDVLEPVSRVNSPENTHDFVPYDLSLEIGPIIAGDMATEELIQVGWISLNLSGSGYLYPWSLTEAVRRASSSESIRELTDVVRTMWPVSAAAPEAEIVELRRRIPDVWPYEADRPWDWYWGAHETG